MYSTSEPSIPSDHGKENEIPNSESPGISSINSSSVAANVSNEPSNEDSPSKRKGLIGSLRKQKMRSIGSLRSLRSPIKAKQTDFVAHPSVHVATVDSELVPPLNCQNPHTPNHPPKSSLALNFQESLPGQPIFDLSSKGYPSSGFDIRRSSPVSVPSSEKQSLQSPAELSGIPNGTVPSSPAPIRKILDLDPTEDSPPKIFSSCRVPSQIMIKAKSPVEKPFSSILRAAADHYHVPTVEGQGKPTSSEPFAQTVEHEKTPTNTESWGTWCEHNRGLFDGFDGKSPPEDAKDDDQHSVRDRKKGGTSTRHNVTALDLLRQKQCANIYRRADGKRQMQVRLTGSDSENFDETAWRDKIEVVSAGPNEDFIAAEKIVSDLGVFARDDRIFVRAGGKEFTPDQAHAAGKIPAYVDIELEPSRLEGTESCMLQPGDMGKHGSSWGAHAGLYDGTGYGSGSRSTSRPTTARNGTESDQEGSIRVRTRANNLSTGTASSDTQEYRDYADFEDFLSTRHVS